MALSLRNKPNDKILDIAVRRVMRNVAKGYVVLGTLPKDWEKYAYWGSRASHALGHYTGFAGHENDRLFRSGILNNLKNGAVFTLEPGLYLPSVGAVRIESTLAVLTGGVEVLTPTPNYASVLKINGVSSPLSLLEQSEEFSVRPVRNLKRPAIFAQPPEDEFIPEELRFNNKAGETKSSSSPAAKNASAPIKQQKDGLAQENIGITSILTSQISASSLNVFNPGLVMGTPSANPGPGLSPERQQERLNILSSLNKPEDSKQLPEGPVKEALEHFKGSSITVAAVGGPVVSLIEGQKPKDVDVVIMLDRKESILLRLNDWLYKLYGKPQIPIPSLSHKLETFRNSLAPIEQDTRLFRLENIMVDLTGFMDRQGRMYGLDGRPSDRMKPSIYNLAITSRGEFLTSQQGIQDFKDGVIRLQPVQVNDKSAQRGQLDLQAAIRTLGEANARGFNIAPETETLLSHLTKSPVFNEQETTIFRLKATSNLAPFNLSEGEIFHSSVRGLSEFRCIEHLNFELFRAFTYAQDPFALSAQLKRFGLSSALENLIGRDLNTIAQEAHSLKQGQGASSPLGQQPARQASSAAAEGQKLATVAAATATVIGAEDVKVVDTAKELIIRKAMPKVGNYDRGGGIGNYLKRTGRVGRYLPTKLLRDELPYQAELRPSQPIGRLPEAWDELPRVNVEFPDGGDVFLVSKLFSGSAGVVRLGFLDDGRPVALKTYYFSDPNDDNSSELLRAVLLRDFRGAKLADYLGIGPITHGVFQNRDGKWNIVMDIVPGDFSDAMRE